MNGNAFIIDAVRTPIGRHGGALAQVRPDDLAAVSLKAVIARTGIDPATVDDVILGCANQAGEDNRNVARMAALLADFPVEIAGQTINRLCGSGLQAVNSAAHAIVAGDADVIVAGGVESMTRAPFVMLKPAEGFARGAPAVADTVLGWRFTNARFPAECGDERRDERAVVLDHLMLERRAHQFSLSEGRRALVLEQRVEVVNRIEVGPHRAGDRHGGSDADGKAGRHAAQAGSSHP